MGFLDFLKKDKPAPPSVDLDAVQQKIDGTGDMGDFDLSSDAPFDSPDAPPPSPPQDWSAPPENAPAQQSAPAPPDAFGLSDTMDNDSPISPPNRTDRRPGNPVPTASMMTTPIKNAEDMSGLIQEEEYDDIPIPPPSLQDPDFLQSAADDMSEPEPRVVEKVVEKIVDRPVNRPVPVQPIQQIDLPDFSDEDIASLEVADTTPAPAPMPKPTPMPPPRPQQSQSERVGQWSPPPVQRREPSSELAVPEEPDGVQPFQGHPAFGSLEPAMFLSSDAYFLIADNIKDARKLLRANDDVIKEALLRHEKGDDQLARVAVDVNAIQESFMQVDASLFEE